MAAELSLAFQHAVRVRQAVAVRKFHADMGLVAEHARELALPVIRPGFEHLAAIHLARGGVRHLFGQQAEHRVDDLLPLRVGHCATGEAISTRQPLRSRT